MDEKQKLEILVNVYCVGETDWYAGRNIDEVINYVMKVFDIPQEDVEKDICLLTDEQMNTLEMFDDDHRTVLGTFREVLDSRIESGMEFPCFFASREW